MRCPYCGSEDDKVVETRTVADGEGIRRRRECLSCLGRYTSYERIEEKPLMVIKRDGTRQAFCAEKLEKGIVRAFERRRISTEAVDEFVQSVEQWAHVKAKGSREVSTRDIGEHVLEKLYEIDKVAYIRFASAYRHFESLDEFITEIRNIEKRHV